MRLVLASAVFASMAAALFANIPASQAQDGNSPWCAVVNTGFDNVSEHCIFRTFEDCYPFVLAGNRGFCEQNVRYGGEPIKYRTKRRALTR